MKVGILTFHHTTNYGATLQTYALSTAIKNQGHDVEIIDYRPHKAVKYYQKPLKPITDRMGRLNPHFIGYLVQFLKIRMFLVSKMKLSKKKYYTKDDLKKSNQPYDVVICGSDQIWCMGDRAPWWREFDPSYFLDFVDSKTNCRKISYAASFGSINYLGKNQELICQLISQFDAISVRDSNSLRLVRQECNRQAIRVLDPTFLIEYNEIILVPPVRDKYLLLYNQDDLTLEQENLVKSIAKIKELVIISIGKYNRITDNNLIGIGPKEWIGYFSKASYVITNTYHGSIFSIIFKKPFTVFSNSGKANKLNDLLSHLGLESRINLEPMDTGYIQPEAFFNIDYDLVYQKLDKDILNSKKYLFEVIDGKQKPNIDCDRLSIINNCANRGGAELSINEVNSVEVASKER